MDEFFVLRAPSNPVGVFSSFSSAISLICEYGGEDVFAVTLYRNGFVDKVVYIGFDGYGNVISLKPSFALSKFK